MGQSVLFRNHGRLTHAQQINGTCKTKQLRKQRRRYRIKKKGPSVHLKPHTIPWHCEGDHHWTILRPRLLDEHIVTVVNKSAVGSLCQNLWRAGLLLRGQFARTWRNTRWPASSDPLGSLENLEWASSRPTFGIGMVPLVILGAQSEKWAPSSGPFFHGLCRVVEKTWTFENTKKIRNT